MRPLLVVLAGACASVLTSLTVWAAVAIHQPPYCEVLSSGLVRTTASEINVNVAVAELLDASRPSAVTAEESYVKCGYREAADAWFSQPDLFGCSQERASRLVREQTDKQGRAMRIEVLRGAEMPTLVFVHHEVPEVAALMAKQFAVRLAEKGVTLR